MITSNLIGGLGNYMFQLSASHSLAWENNDEAIFNINDNIKVHNHLSTYKDNILRNINFVNTPLNTRVVFNEPFFHYNPIKYRPNIRLNGYYQSEKYFVKNRDRLLKLYEIDEVSKNYINDKYKIHLNQPTCSIHVRRGDYLNLPNHHPVCELDYYLESIKLFPNTKFLVVSNDIEWCKNNFKGADFIFIEDNPDYIDMWLMSLCDNNIIANSSFSWWGAWLNKNENKKVIVPKKWFGQSIKHKTDDLIPSTWIQI